MVGGREIDLLGWLVDSNGLRMLLLLYPGGEPVRTVDGRR